MCMVHVNWEMISEFINVDFTVRLFFVSTLNILNKLFNVVRKAIAREYSQFNNLIM